MDTFLRYSKSARDHESQAGTAGFGEVRPGGEVRELARVARALVQKEKSRSVTGTATSSAAAQQTSAWTGSGRRAGGTSRRATRAVISASTALAAARAPEGARLAPDV